MNKKKKLIAFIIVLVLVLLIVGIILFKDYNKPASYEWIKEENSVINQQRLYINNKNDKHIEGYVRITYLNGTSKKELIPKEGKMYVKSVIKEVKVINKR
jgi:hypothetical protein